MTQAEAKERTVEVKTTQAGVKIKDFSVESKLNSQTIKDELLNINRDDKLYELLEPELDSAKKSITKPDPLRFRQTLKSPKKLKNNMSENWFITQGAMVRLGFEGNAQTKYQKIGNQTFSNPHFRRQVQTQHDNSDHWREFRDGSWHYKIF